MIPVSPSARLVRAAAAAALGLVVLTGTGSTSASWVDRVEREPGTITSGGVSTTSEPSRAELHSRQPVGSRTCASSTGCTPDAGFTECRVITGTIAREALIPGDRVVVIERATLTATGDNLTGTMQMDARGLTSASLSQLSGSATTSTTTTPPSGGPVTGSTATFPVSVASGQGLGTYTVRAAITVPPSRSGTAWGSALTSQQLYDGTVSFTFTQT